MNTSQPRSHAKRLFLTRYPHVEVTVFALGVALLLVPAFEVPVGAQSYVQLPGVLISILCAGLASVSFLSCPRTPLWAKLVALVLALPTLYLAVDAVLRYALYVLKVRI